jgi:hypothetical protein
MGRSSQEIEYAAHKLDRGVRESHPGTEYERFRPRQSVANGAETIRSQFSVYIRQRQENRLESVRGD